MDVPGRRGEARSVKAVPEFLCHIINPNQRVPSPHASLRNVHSSHQVPTTCPRLWVSCRSSEEQKEVLVFEESASDWESLSTFTGSDYRAIPGNQLLNRAGQTASALGGEESELTGSLGDSGEAE